MKKNIGSALLITILIIGTVGAIALALGRLTLSEIKISSSLSDSVIAYFAAEGGLEDGLWRYRVNHEEQDPCSTGRTWGNNPFEATCSDNIVEGAGKVDRYNYSNSQFSPNLNPQASPIIADQRVYDLRIYFKKTQCLGYTDDACTAKDISSNMYKLIADQSKTFDIKPALIGTNLNFAIDKIVGSANFWIEVKFYKSTGSDPTTSNIFPLPPAFVFDDFSFSITVPNNAIKMVVKLLSQNESSDFAIRFYIDSGSNNKFLDTGYTYIDSTGYYGQTKRRLRMTIDRESGNILSLLDYALYASPGEISQ